MKKKYYILAAICIIGCIICILLTMDKFKKKPVETPPIIIDPPVTDTYTSPIDFKALQERNPDVYGWLSIPGTEISYPVLQNQEDDSLYLNYDIDKNLNSDGALYTEHTYNSLDFSDPVTLIYGHHQLSGAMFGNLQEFFTDRFDELDEIVIYRPEEELHYRVFAAVPYDNRHILYSYDFTNPATYNNFVSDVTAIRAIGASIREDATPRNGENIIVLSTCLRENRTNRFLVLAAKYEK